MHSYRLYFLRRGSIVHRLELRCDDDEQAIAEVEAHPRKGDRELWDEARLVRKWEGEAD